MWKRFLGLIVVTCYVTACATPTSVHTARATAISNLPQLSGEME